MRDRQIQYITRLATDLDYCYCYELTKENMFDLFSYHWGGWVDSAFQNDFDVDATTIIICNGQRIGYYSLQQDDQGLYLDNIQLSPSFQGQGLGTKVLKNILNSNKLKQIRLTTFSDNPAMRLYQRLGFVITNQEGDTIHLKKSPQ